MCFLLGLLLRLPLRCFVPQHDKNGASFFSMIRMIYTGSISGTTCTLLNLLSACIMAVEVLINCLAC